MVTAGLFLVRAAHRLGREDIPTAPNRLLRCKLKAIEEAAA